VHVDDAFDMGETAGGPAVNAVASLFQPLHSLLGAGAEGVRVLVNEDERVVNVKKDVQA
jgi:hypothetical protein